jgi:Zn-dependent metalloprotease
MLEHIARSDSPVSDEVRRGAQKTLAEVQQLRHGSGEWFAAASPIRSGGKRRAVYDARHRQTLPGKLVMSEKKRRPRDVQVNEAYDGSGNTYDFYANVFSRNSTDDRGARLVSTVHYGNGFDNAFWNGSQMIYGDGDGQLFTRFTIALDVIGHELTHGVTQFTAGLGYQGENGALNEHVSDAFGIMVKQYALNISAADSDWLIGAGLFTPAVRGKAIRSMAAPGTAYDDPVLGRDPQPGHIRDYVHTTSDNGGVHINSGVPNHAFYLAAMAIGGESWRVLGSIWYVVLTTRTRANSGFQAFADATTQVAAARFGANSSVQHAVSDAWAAVGVPACQRLKTRTAVPQPGRRVFKSPMDKWNRRRAVLGKG